MIDILRNAMLSGLGAAAVTREKLDEKLQELVDQGKITAEESAKMRQELLDSGEREWKNVQDKIQENLRKAMDSMDLPSKARVQALEERLADVEKKLTAMELKNNMES